MYLLVIIRERERARESERERDTDRYTIHVCMHTYAMQCQRQVDTCRHTHTKQREKCAPRHESGTSKL